MSEEDLARRKAISLLSKRNYLTSDLEDKLKDKGFSEKAAKFAAEYCTQKGFVNDSREVERRFAKAQKKGKSAKAAFFQLKGKISNADLERHYRQAREQDEAALRAFIEKNEKKIDRSDPKELRKWMGKLYARGFSQELIYRVFDDN